MLNRGIIVGLAGLRAQHGAERLGLSLLCQHQWNCAWWWFDRLLYIFGKLQKRQKVTTLKVWDKRLDQVFQRVSNSYLTKTAQNTKWAVCGSKYMSNWILNLGFRKCRRCDNFWTICSPQNPRKYELRIWIVAQARKWKCHGWGVTPCGFPARWWGVTCIIMVTPKNLTAKRDWLVWSPPPPLHKVPIYIWNWGWVTLFLDIIGSHKTVTVHVTVDVAISNGLVLFNLVCWGGWIFISEIGDGTHSYITLDLEGHSVIPHICHFWYATKFFRPVKGTPKKCVNSRQKLHRDKTE